MEQARLQIQVQLKRSGEYTFPSWRKHFRLNKVIVKFTTAVMIVSCTASGIFAQQTITGKVKSGQQNLSFATVVLLDEDSSVLKEMMTDVNGDFMFQDIQKGRYRVSSSMVGHVTFLTQPISVEANDVVLPDITLSPATAALSELIVKARKPVFEQQIDRLVINVQSSVSSAGNTVLEVLQKSPGIVVNRQDNTISMNGKSGVRIMINGKLMQLPLDVVVQMLDGMTAANVDRIELITTPPAKYDAEGNAGIIHIIMKGSPDVGTNGSFGLTLGYHWAGDLGGNFNLNHRGGKFAYFIDYSIVRNHNLHTSKLERKSTGTGFIQQVNDYSRRENITTQQNLNAGVEWKLTGNTSLNLAFTAYRRNWDLNAYNNDSNYVTRDSSVFTNMKIYESNIWQSATGSMGMQTRINSKSEITISLDYLYYHNNNPSNYDNESFYAQHQTKERSKIELNKSTPIRFWIAKADYQYELSSSLTWEAGLKAVTSRLDNDVLVRQFVNNSWSTDTFFTSYSTLDEQVGAAYISTKWKAGNNWQVNSGVRYEYTHTRISTPDQKNLIDRKYGYLFPGLFLKKDIDRQQDFQISYSRRITRPTYNDIAPFVFFWGPNTFSAGNTSIKPAIADAVKAGYHLRKWIISLEFTHSGNEISFLQPEKDTQSDKLIYRSQNLAYLNTLGITNAWSFTVKPWWEVQTNLGGQYQTALTASLRHNTKLRLYGFTVNVVNSMKLPKDFAIEISGMYRSRSLSGISEFLPVTLLNAGIQKKFGDKGTLRLAIDDILNNNYWRVRTYMPEDNLDSYFSYDFNNRFVRLTYTRSFGNKKLRSVKLTSGSDEERGRVTN